MANDTRVKVQFTRGVNAKDTTNGTITFDTQNHIIYLGDGTDAYSYGGGGGGGAIDDITSNGESLVVDRVVNLDKDVEWQVGSTYQGMPIVATSTDAQQLATLTEGCVSVSGISGTITITMKSSASNKNYGFQVVLVGGETSFTISSVKGNAISTTNGIKIASDSQDFVSGEAPINVMFTNANWENSIWVMADGTTMSDPDFYTNAKFYIDVKPSNITPITEETIVTMTSWGLVDTTSSSNGDESWDGSSYTLHNATDIVFVDRQSKKELLNVSQMCQCELTNNNYISENTEWNGSTSLVWNKNTQTLQWVEMEDEQMATSLQILDLTQSTSQETYSISDYAVSTYTVVNDTNTDYVSYTLSATPLKGVEITLDEDNGTFVLDATDTTYHKVAGTVTLTATDTISGTTTSKDVTFAIYHLVVPTSCTIVDGTVPSTIDSTNAGSLTFTVEYSPANSDYAEGTYIWLYNSTAGLSVSTNDDHTEITLSWEAGTSGRDYLEIGTSSDAYDLLDISFTISAAAE